MSVDAREEPVRLSAEDELDPARWRALALGVAALGLVLLDLGIVNVILPPIGASLHANPSQLLWIVAGYAVAIGVVPVIAGRLGDDHGRRRMLCIGVAGFIAMSAVVGTAPNMTVLLTARALQGLFGGLINPQVSGLVQQLFPLHERGRAFGWIGAAVGVFTAAGPALGGALVALGGPDLGWRLCFLVNIPSGIVVLLLCRKWWPARSSASRQALDLPGAGLLTTALLCALFPAVEFATHRSVWLVAVLVASVPFGALFVWWEAGPARTRGHPLIDVSLFRIRSFANGLGIGLCYFSAFNVFGIVLALYLQQGLRLTTAQAGCVVALYALGTSVGAVRGGRLLARHGARVLPASLRRFAIAVTAIAVIAALLSGRVAAGYVVAALSVPLLVAGLGGGGVVSPNQALALADLGTRGGSTAGGMLQTAQRLGNAGGAAVLSSTYYFVAGSHRSVDATIAGRAFAVALALALLFGLLALVLAVRDVRYLQREATIEPDPLRGTP